MCDCQPKVGIDIGNTVVHTGGMNVQKMTISMPKYLYEDLLALVPRGEVSSFIAEATEREILDRKIKPKNDLIADFFNLRRITPKLTDSQIMAAIRKGRM